jgi:hypothetical protein
MAVAEPLLGLSGAYFAAALVGGMFFVAFFFIR